MGPEDQCYGRYMGSVPQSTSGGVWGCVGACGVVWCGVVGVGVGGRLDVIGGSSELLTIKSWVRCA